MAVKNHKDTSRVAVDSSLLEWAEYWYPISWKGVLLGGVITAVGACATIAFLLLQWRTTTIREEQSDWRTSVLEADTEGAKADLALAQAEIAKAHAQLAKTNLQILEAQGRLNETRGKFEEFRKKTGARFVDHETFVNALRAANKATVEILYLRDGADCVRFAGFLRQFIIEAGWTVSRMESVPSIEDKASNPQVLDANPAMGISLFGSNDERAEDEAAGWPIESTTRPFPVLVRELLNAVMGMTYGWSEKIPPGTIRIIVAPP